ncbi:Beta-galactosidase 9 [Camellia lanceoleosa]|uniref:Beta-galactosidase 9 n=1 Tax=Camellia lanceoleosa TaxID=1840588 RepID=A0ACC0GUQ8_9ERIC|nr:Beta-galactosidase 9 [Camellia lanceoleosa]
MFGTRRSSLQCLAFALTLHIAVIAGEFFKPFNVTYDHRALIIDGKRRMLNSAGIKIQLFNFQSSCMSRDRTLCCDFAIANPKRGMRCTSNASPKVMRWQSSYNLFCTSFPWKILCFPQDSSRGFPVWLHDVPGIVFRTDNAPFKDEMQRFVKKIVDLKREEMLFSWQSGLIIMLQIDTCNEYYCDGYKQIPTRNRHFGQRIGMDGTRSGVEHGHIDLLKTLHLQSLGFFERGGSFQNYYMFVGGTNFGRTAGGPNYITSYNYDAPIDEYGLLRQPRWGRLKDLHDAIKLCEPALVAVDSPQYMKLGPKQEAHLYGSVAGHWVNVDQPVQLKQGYNDLVLLSETIGLQNYGAFLEKDGAGFNCPIKLIGFRNGDIDLSNSLWTYQVGLKGEFMKIYTIDEIETAGWTDLTLDAIPSTFS